jgi:hypothetical protein
MDIDKFNELSAKVASKPIDNPSSQIEKLEIRLEMRLPEAYRNFLLAFCAPVIFQKRICFKPKQRSPWTCKDGTQNLISFYGLGNCDGNLIKEIGIYEKRMPECVIPIGDLPGGNQLCLSLSPPSEGCIFVWDHENEMDKKFRCHRSFQNMYLAADSFDDFIKGLYPMKDDVLPNELKDIGVKRIKLDF